MKLFLGCGKSRREGFLGVDIVKNDVVDLVHDLNVFPWPFDDSQVDEILMINIMEHLPDTIRVMEEVWRISKKLAKIYISVPYYNSPGASQDPTHVKFFTENSFDYFTPDNESQLSFYNYYSKARFKVLRVHPCQSGWLYKLPIKLQWLLAHHFATVHGLQFDLQTVK